jgi:hypothetical protein
MKIQKRSVDERERRLARIPVERDPQADSIRNLNAVLAHDLGAKTSMRTNYRHRPLRAMLRCA